MEVGLIRNLNEDEIAFVSGGKHSAGITEVPPPQEPEIPLLPGIPVS